MSGQIEFVDLAIRKLFQNFYLIPEYQREYVWSERQVSQLLNDIYSEFSNNPESEYFLGSLVVCRARESLKYEVIDGQQRLITLSLVLNNLRRKFRLVGEEKNAKSIENLLYSESITELGETIYSHIIDVQYEGRDVLHCIYDATNDDEINPKTIEGLPGKTIFEAHQIISFFIDESFKIENDISDLKRFFGYFLNKVKVIQIETPNIGNALKIFETINDRGVSLDQVDLLKNLLFIQINRQDFPRLNREWSKFKECIVGQKVKEKPLRFLRYFIMANYEISRENNPDRIIREDDIYKWFVDNEKQCNYRTESLGFVKQIQLNAGFYVNLIKNRYYDEPSHNLKSVSLLLGSGFKQHFLLLLSAKNLKPSYFDHLVRQLEVLLFYYNITKEPPRDIEKRFASWSSEIREIRTASNLNDFIISRIQADVKNRLGIYEANFSNLSYKSMQKNKLKYVLGKLTQFVDQKRMGEPGNDSLDPYVKRTVHIEHILPETPTDEILQAFSDGNSSDYHRYVQKLGNLTLLERPINTSIQRNFFSEKCSAYSQSMFYLTRAIHSLEDVGVSTSMNRVNSLLSSFTRWDKDSIDTRQKMLVELSYMVWKVELYNE